MKKFNILIVFWATLLLSACTSTSPTSEVNNVSNHAGAVYTPIHNIVCTDIEVELNGFDIQDRLELKPAGKLAASDFSNTEYKLNGFISETLPDNVVGLKISKIQLGIMAEFSEVDLYLLLRPNGEMFSSETPFMVTQYGSLNFTLLASANCNFTNGVNFELVH